MFKAFKSLGVGFLLGIRVGFGVGVRGLVLNVLCKIV